MVRSYHAYMQTDRRTAMLDGGADAFAMAVTLNRYSQLDFLHLVPQIMPRALDHLSY